MTIDWLKIAGMCLGAQKYNPSPLPPQFGDIWYPMGWVDHFNDEGPDPNRSLGCHWEGSGLIGNPPQPGRSYVSAKRTRGATVFSLETVLNQAQPLAGPPWGAVPYVVGGVSAQVGVTPVEYLGGQLSVSPISGQGDPAIDGKAINMSMTSTDGPSDSSATSSASRASEAWAPSSTSQARARSTRAFRIGSASSSDRADAPPSDSLSRPRNAASGRVSARRFANRVLPLPKGPVM